MTHYYVTHGVGQADKNGIYAEKKHDIDKFCIVKKYFILIITKLKLVKYCAKGVVRTIFYCSQIICKYLLLLCLKQLLNYQNIIMLDEYSYILFLLNHKLEYSGYTYNFKSRFIYFIIIIICFYFSIV